MRKKTDSSDFFESLVLAAGKISMTPSAAYGRSTSCADVSGAGKRIDSLGDDDRARRQLAVPEVGDVDGLLEHDRLRRRSVFRLLDLQLFRDDVHVVAACRARRTSG